MATVEQILRRREPLPGRLTATEDARGGRRVEESGGCGRAIAGPTPGR